MKFYLLLINLGLIFNTCLGVQNKELKASTLTYLGIYATPVNPSVSNQLNLTANFYLNVERVESNSPAEKGGVQKFDLLMQFNDQVLINPEQLKCLVRSKKPGEEVVLTILRKGKREMITLTLGKINRTIERRFPHLDRGYFPFQADPIDRDNFLNDSSINDLIDRYTENHSFHFNNSLGRHKRINPRSLPDDDPLHPKAIKESFSNQTSQSQVMITDGEGTLEWSEKNGQKSLRATDPYGKVLFDGPIDNEGERKALPENLKSRLEKLEKQINSK
jgi:hypothetical protein